MLACAFIGFQKLYQMVGYFRVSEDMVCMDRDGQVKAWLNSDLSQCYIADDTFRD